MKKLLLIIMLASPLYATTYYVSASGNDAANGTSTSTPWASLFRIGRTAYVAGDSILLKRGDVFEGQILDTLRGSAASKIVIGTYGTGAKPIIYGDLRGRAWIPITGRPGLYKAYIGGYSTILTGFWQMIGGTWTRSTGMVYRSTSSAAWEAFLDSVYAGRMGTNYEHDTLFVHTFNNVTFPGSDSLRIYRYNSKIMETSKNYIVRDIKFNNSMIGFSAYGDSMIVRGIETSYCPSGGFSFQNASHGLMDSCVIDSSGDTGIYYVSVKNTIVRHNLTKNVMPTLDGFPGTGVDLCGVGILDHYNATQSGNGYNTIEYNTFYNIYRGFTDWYFCIGDTVRYNTGHNGSAAGSPHGKNLVMTHNDFVGGAAGMNGSNIDQTGLGTITFSYNSIDSVTNYGIWVSGNDSAAQGGTINLNHNIIRTIGSSRTYADYKTTAGISSDYNYYFGTAGRFTRASTAYYDIPTFYAATGFDQNSTLNVDAPVEEATNTISVYSGDNQSKVLKSSVSISSYVTDTSGLPIPGIVVTYAIASAPPGATGQVLSATSDTTDTFGTASTTLTLGNKAGTYTVTATSAGLTGSPLTFTANATRSGYKVFSRVRR